MGNKKIDEALGISGIDDLMKDLDIEKDVRQLNEIENQIQENVDSIDTQIKEFNDNGLQGINVADLNSSLNEIKDLIIISKNTIQHVYDQITDMEMIDSEAVQALGKVIESSHLAIKEYVDIFRDRVAFYDKVRLEAIKHQYKLEEMREKQKLDIEKWNATSVQKEVTVENQNTVGYSQEDIIKSMTE